ncbi:multimerin-1 isoform X2 [Ochotona curzoniae]|uniref:multimerin-1 isoform X2 n=1 Tax=Ochotona curzoniae TaxID=130825 RepID=UPI001B3523BA|nr:multimerin-1 isoform X2 [Ochotona curzoniae]
MKGAGFLVLLACVWSGGIGLQHTGNSWSAPEHENSQNITSAPVAPKTEIFQVLPTAQPMLVEIASIVEEGTSKKNLSQSARPFLETGAPTEGVRNQTPAHTEVNEEVKLQNSSLQKQLSVTFKPGAESVVLSNTTLKFLQSFANESKLQMKYQNSSASASTLPLRETSLSRADSDGSQGPDHSRSSFKTTGRKNWCAYVQTSLTPTLILDRRAPGSRSPCSGNSETCAQRFQKTSNFVYRIQHKIVTSFQWKCCPGYSGPECQTKAQEQHQLTHNIQADSAATGTETSGQPLQQQDCSDSVAMQKMTNHINNQAMKLTNLQKKVDNITLAVNDVKSTYSSLEGKISEDKGKEFQYFLKGLKSKSINNLIKDIVSEQFKIFQNEMQETVAQLFKTVSSLSADLENTRQLIRQVNESVVSIEVQQKTGLRQENMPTLPDIVSLKNHIVDVRQEITSACEKSVKELEAKQAHLESTLAQDRSRSFVYYDSLNKTLSKMNEVHEQLLSDQKNVPAAASVSHNGTEYMSTLSENIKKQGLMLMQMCHDLHIQESKINNLTITLEKEKESVRDECEDLFSKCRNDFKFQLKDTEENLNVLNQTLAEVLFPMDDKMNKMSEQLNDFTYDMEILQPLLEQGASLRLAVGYEQTKEAVLTRKKVETLTSDVDRLNILVKELLKRYNLLVNEVQRRGDTCERRMNQYTLEMEDGLNKTMTVINNAIDYIQDNYVLKESLGTIEYNSEVHNTCSRHMETILAFISQFQRLNESIENLTNDNHKYYFVLQVAKALADIPNDEKSSQLNSLKIYQMFNETISQIIKYQQNMSHFEEKIRLATKISEHFEAQLQEIESRITQTLIPYYISPKKGSVATNDKNQALQLQVLNSRFKALEAKSIHLSADFSLLNKTLNEVLTMCLSTSTNILELNATIPTWIRNSLPDTQLLEKALTEFVQSIIEIKTQAVLSNLTEYIDRSLSGSLANAVKSKKQVKSLLKKSSMLKKPTVNLTTVLVGRTQRNTDNIVSPVTEEYSGCSSLPCQNGGTCINGISSFTCACRHPFTGDNCTVKLAEENILPPDFSKGSYTPMVAFFVSHNYGMTTPGPILFNDLHVNYGASYTPTTGRFRVPYRGVYVFKYTIESFSSHLSGFLVVDGRDKFAFESENTNNEIHCDRVVTGDVLLELNYGQEVWVRLVKGGIPRKSPPTTAFGGYLLYRT